MGLKKLLTRQWRNLRYSPSGQGRILVEQHSRIHEQDSGYGRDSEHLLAYVQNAILELAQIRSIYDYGCGKSRLVDWLAKLNDATAFRFDPAISEFQIRPILQADIVLTIHVLEHIPEPDIDRVLADIRSISPNVYFQIVTEPAGPILANGQVECCTLKPADWWKQRIEQYFSCARDMPANQKGQCAFVTWNVAGRRDVNSSLDDLIKFCKDMANRDCIVFGSAPEPRLGSYHDEKIICCNGSAVSLSKYFGLAPDFTVIHNHVFARGNQADIDVRNALSAVESFGRTIIFDNSRYEYSLDLLGNKSVDPFIFNWKQRFALIHRLLGVSLPFLDNSTGAMAVCCALIAGAKSVRLVGFSLDQRGHSYNKNGLHRNHVRSDAALYAMLKQKKFEVSSLDPSISMILTSKIK